MIREDMLRRAAEEVSDAIVASVPEEAQEFSCAFEEKMDALCRDQERSVAQKVLQEIAVAVAVLAVSVGTIFVLSPAMFAGALGLLN